MSHVDKLRSGVPSQEYRVNHERIFGPPGGAGNLTEEEKARQEKNRKAHHAKEVADGKKDAQYYLDHEVRVAADPSFRMSPLTTEEYKSGWNRVFGEKG